MIHKYFPDVETIACYASIRNIKPKSVEDLKKLRAAGYDCFYIGLETAYDPALDQMRKGYTQKDEYDAIITLGAVIEGATDHDQIVAQHASRKIQS